MPPRIRVTKLVTLTGSEIGGPWKRQPFDNVFDLAKDAVAAWADVWPSEVSFEETEGGEFFCVDGDPVASLETSYVPSTPRLRAPLGKDQSAACPVAMEVV